MRVTRFRPWLTIQVGIGASGRFELVNDIVAAQAHRERNPSKCASILPPVREATEERGGKSARAYVVYLNERKKVELTYQRKKSVHQVPSSLRVAEVSLTTVSCDARRRACLRGPVSMQSLCHLHHCAVVVSKQFLQPPCSPPRGYVDASGCLW